MQNPPRFLWIVLLFGVAGCASGGPLIRQAAALNSRGAVQLAGGDADAAEASFRVALEYNDRYAEPHNNLGLVALQRGRVGLARQHFRAAISRNPDFAEAWSNLGIALSRSDGVDDSERSPVTAAQAWRQALAINPGLMEARMNLSRALLATGHNAEALVQARRVVQVAERLPLGHALRAEAALANGNMAEALAASNRARELAPGDPEVQLVGARMDLLNDRLCEAVDALTLLVRIARVADEAHALLAAVHLARGDREGAQRELGAMSESARTNPVARTVTGLLAR